MNAEDDIRGGIHVGQVLAVEDLDYVVSSVLYIHATEFTLQIGTLVAADSDHRRALALRDGELYEAAPLRDISPPPSEAGHLRVGNAWFCLLASRPATLEVQEKGRSATFDRGELSLFVHTVGAQAGLVAPSISCAEGEAAPPPLKIADDFRAERIEALLRRGTNLAEACGECYLVVFTSARRLLGFLLHSMPPSSVAVYGTE
jgi:hypothetical protein